MRTVLAGSLSPSAPTYSWKCFLVSVTPQCWRDVLPGSQLRSESWCGTLRSGHRTHQLPKILKASSNAEEEVSQWAGEMQNTKLYPGLWKVPNRFDPQYATGICSFLLCCYSTMNHNKGWRIQARESSSGTLSSYNARGRFFLPEYRRDGPSLEQTEGCINIYHPLPNIHWKEKPKSINFKWEINKCQIKSKDYIKAQESALPLSDYSWQVK